MKRITKFKVPTVKPKGFKSVDAKDFVSDMEELGSSVAKDFKVAVKENIRKNKYGFKLKEATVRRKGSDTPLIDSGELVDSIYRRKTKVSVKDTPREDSTLTNLELALVHEYGAKDVGIPPRPVFRNTFRDFKHPAKNKLETFFKTESKGKGKLK